MLKKKLYKTTISVVDACKDLEICPSEPELEELLEGLEGCTNCDTWFHSYELIPDLDGNNICTYCRIYYGE